MIGILRCQQLRFAAIEADAIKMLAVGITLGFAAHRREVELPGRFIDGFHMCSLRSCRL